MPNVARVRTRTLPLALTLGLALCVGALTLAPAISADAVPATPKTVTTASTLDCVTTPVWSYTWNAAASSGTVTATGGAPGQPVCTPLSIRAVSWMYDSPLNGGNPSWPQSFSAKSDYTIGSIGTFAFASPGVSCGQDDIYATFSPDGFAALALSPVLTGPGAPSEPPFLHQAIAGVGGTGTGGSTWHTDPSAGCTTTVGVLKQAVTTAGTTPVTETAPGGSFDYTIDVSNSGHLAAAGITVSDTVPASLEITGPVVAPNWSCTTVTQAVNCTFPGQLAGGASASTIRIPVKLAETAAEPNVANTATLCGTNIGACQSSQAVVVIAPVPPVVPPVEPPVVPPVQPPVVPPLALSDLEVQKTASLTTVQIGGAFTYSVTASNPGAGTTQDVVVTDTLDPRMRLTSTPSGSGWACTVITPGYGASFECVLPYGLAAGSPKTFSLGVQVDPAADAVTKPYIDNTAEACGTSVDCVSSTARVALSSDQLPTLPLPPTDLGPTDVSPANGDLPTLALHDADAALAHAGVDPSATTMISIGALVLGLGLTVIAAGRRRQRQS